MPVERSRAGLWLGLLLVTACFGAPLFVGLGEWDMRNDEAIYSYAAERILETGDWVTPRLIPTDWPFFEKPPLKFWIVAGAMSLGLTPENEFGLRFFDALFGAVAFAYVYVLGWRLGGVIAGLTSVLTLFTLDPLIFEHGLRSNNMEAAVVLGYCGGVYHFVRWMDAPSRSKLHALAVAGYFLLAFMTKMVAALFLPAICVAALLSTPRRQGLERLRIGWREWIGPTLVAIVLAAPWFVYHSIQTGREFWQILIGQHVVTRFTGALDPTHLNPWHFYFTTLQKEAAYSGGLILILIGLARLAFDAWRNDSWLSRVVLLWGFLPLAAISIGTSKLLHYAYPFWPPFGLAAGMAVATMLQAAEGASGRFLKAKLTSLVPRRLRAWAEGSRPRRILQALTLVAIALVAWTLFFGPLTIEVGGVRVFRNSSIARPLAIAVLLVIAQGYVTTLIRLTMIVLVALLLPGGTYIKKVERTTQVDHPLRSLRDCMTQVHASSARVGQGVLVASDDVLHHGYFYYFRKQGPWEIARTFSVDDVRRRLQTPGTQTPVILERDHYERFYASDGTSALVTPPGAIAASDGGLTWSEKDGVAVEDHVVMLLPGPFAQCVQPALEAGARPLWKPASLVSANEIGTPPQ
jgi:4-amino-4-deoxy-L-arabinose transferase-like glycosyltransferase